MAKQHLLVAAALCTGAFAASAADTNRWETSAALGLTITRGNSDTSLGTIGLTSTKKRASDEFLLGASATYGRTEVEETTVIIEPPAAPREVKSKENRTTTANASGFAQYNRSINDAWYAGLRFDVLHDSIADVDYRATLSPLIGYYAVKRPATTLKFEAGPSLVAEKVGGETDVYAALRLAERFEHKFSDRAKVWQSLEFLPQIDDFENYIINAELGAEAALNDSLSLRAVLQDTYDNQPAAGRKHNDLKLLTSIVYKF
jgi:putative salt-induced outer membrane protein YdiY